MRISTRIVVGCLALLGCGLTAQRADAGFNISSSNSGLMVFTGTGDTFTFTENPNFTVQTGTAAGLNGVITGDYTIGAISGTILQEAAVTGSGTFQIFDGAFTLSATVTFNTIQTIGDSSATGGFLRNQASVNLTGITYGGTNSDLEALRDAVPGGKLVVTFSFIEPGKTLTDLTQDGAVNSTSFQGVLAFDEGGGGGVPAPAGLVLLATALPVLGVMRLRRKVAVA